jgi:hypothetical protein
MQLELNKENGLELDLSAIPKGIYMLVLQFENGTTLRRRVVRL